MRTNKDRIEEKRKILSQYFIDGVINFSRNYFEAVKDLYDPPSNIRYAGNSSWISLLQRSIAKYPNISIVTIDENTYGLLFDDPECAEIYQIAVKKIMPELMFQLDTDDESDIINRIVDYIKNNNLTSKSFYNLIRKIKNLNSDLLTEE